MSISRQQQEILNQVQAFSRHAMTQNDPAHDEAHVERVVKLTRQLCSAYPEADPFRAELLAWVHDLSDDKLVSNLGNATISDILTQIGVGKEDIAFILHGIPYISYRKYPALSPDVALEIRIVQDADRIDAMGAIGIARTFAYGGSKGRHLLNSLAHFDEKLLKLHGLLNTEAAKKLASDRYDFLWSFYQQFLKEWECE